MNNSISTNNVGYLLSLSYFDPNSNLKIPVTIDRLTIIKTPILKTNNIYLITFSAANKILKGINYLITQNNTYPLFYFSLTGGLIDIDINQSQPVIKKLTKYEIKDKQLLLYKILNTEDTKITAIFIDQSIYTLLTSKSISARLIKLENIHSYKDLYSLLFNIYKSIYNYTAYDTTILDNKYLISAIDRKITLTGLFNITNITDINLPTYISHTLKTHKIPVYYYFDDLFYDYINEMYVKSIVPTPFYSCFKENINKPIIIDITNANITNIYNQTHLNNLLEYREYILYDSDHNVERYKTNSNTEKIARVYTPDTTNNAIERISSTYNLTNKIIRIDEIEIYPPTDISLFDIGRYYKFSQIYGDDITVQFLSISYDFFPRDSYTYQSLIRGQLILYKN